jgi:hypothetical protein
LDICFNGGVLVLALLPALLLLRSSTARENRFDVILAAGGRMLGLLVPKLLLRDAAALGVTEEVPEEVPEAAAESAEAEAAGSDILSPGPPALCWCTGTGCCVYSSAADEAVLLGLAQSKSSSSSSLFQPSGSLLLSCSDILLVECCFLLKSLLEPEQAIQILRQGWYYLLAVSNIACRR